MVEGGEVGRGRYICRMRWDGRHQRECVLDTGWGVDVRGGLVWM